MGQDFVKDSAISLDSLEDFNISPDMLHFRKARTESQMETDRHVACKTTVTTSGEGLLIQGSPKFRYLDENLTSMNTSSTIFNVLNSKEKTRKLSLQRESLLFMKGVMDECTHIANFSVPIDPSLIIVVQAREDAYVPRTGVRSLQEIWPGCEIRYLEGGHISAYLFKQAVFRPGLTQCDTSALPPPSCPGVILPILPCGPSRIPPLRLLPNKMARRQESASRYELFVYNFDQFCLYLQYTGRKTPTLATVSSVLYKWRSRQDTETPGMAEGQDLNTVLQGMNAQLQALQQAQAATTGSWRPRGQVSGSPTGETRPAQAAASYVPMGPSEGADAYLGMFERAATRSEWQRSVGVHLGAIPEGPALRAYYDLPEEEALITTSSSPKYWPARH
ncbi:ABD18 protein, partial [Polypterus senegalus]